MSQGYRNGAFALGLVTGGGLALNLFVWLDYRAQYQANQEAQGDYADQYSEIGSWWDWLIRTFVSPSDTLAQWIMAIFTIAAVLLVWRTLVATQEMVRDTKQMAIDTREIGEAQVRAYISVQSAFGQKIPDANGTRLVVVLKNTGASPAHGLNVIITSQLLTNFSEKRVWFKSLVERPLRTDLGAGETRTVSTDIPNVSFDVVEWISQDTGERPFCFVYASYFDTFNRNSKMRRTLLSAVQTGRDTQTKNLILSACERGNRST